MATMRSNTLACGSLSSWIRILRLSTCWQGPIGAPRGVRPRLKAHRGLTPLGAPVRLLWRERVLGRVFLGEDFVDLRFALHGPLNRQLGGLVVVLVDFRVILGLPVDEHAADDHQVFRLALGYDALGNAVGD